MRRLRWWRLMLVVALMGGTEGSYGRDGLGRPEIASAPPLSSIWDQHEALAIAGVVAVVLQAALIVVLLWSRARWRHSQRSLNLSEERYREVVESQTDLICRYLPDTTLTFVNEAYCRYFKRPREELLGRKFLGFIPESAHEAIKQSLAVLLKGQQMRMVEHEVVLPNGEVGWQQWTDYAILDEQGRLQELQGIGRDVTDRKLAEEALRVSEERMRLAAEAAKLGFWGWDVANDRMWMTETWQQRPRNDVAVSYRSFLEHVHPDDREGVESAVRQALERRFPLEHEYRVIQPNGESHWFVARGRCLQNQEGKVTQMIGIHMDVTERKRSEDVMQNLVHATRLALVGELTASIAHEMNQPLGAILSNAEAAELLMAGEAPALGPIREILADIRKDDLRASEVIKHLRALLRKREMQMQPVNLNDIATEALRLVAGDARQRNVTLDRDLAAEPSGISGDPVHLQQVMLNLILNGMDAMQATPVEARRLVVTTRRNSQQQIEVAVSDAGHGIAGEKVDRVFHSFFTTKEDGMGLGLAIARSIVETHGGRIWAENNRDCPGATFFFTIPTIM